ncbi:MAG: hypothetical protein NVS3B7_15290 [Candidatus Elarobacter sp.]
MVKNSISLRSPLSPTHWPEGAFRWWASLGFAVLVALTALGPGLVAVVVLVQLHVLPSHLISATNPTLTWPLLIVQFISYVPLIALLLWALPQLAQRPLRDLGLRTPRWSDVLWGIGGAITMILAVTACAALQQSLFHVKADEVQVQYLRNAHGSLAAGFAFVACVAAPFSEELVFRAFAFNALRRYAPTAVAVLLSAVVFGFAHLQPGNAGAIAPLAAGGIVLALVYYSSASLVASMMTHGLFNLFTVIAVFGFHQTN